MNHDDWIASDTMRAIAKILPPDDPNNPRNLTRAAAAQIAGNCPPVLFLTFRPASFPRELR